MAADAGSGAPNSGVAFGTGRRLRAAWRLLRVGLHLARGVATALLRFPGLEREARRPFVQRWAAGLLARVGVSARAVGAPIGGGSLMVSNHVSWLDIVAIHAVCPQARFVSKADVRRWALLRHLADAADTLYLERERRRDAMRVVQLMGEALAAGDTVAVFPEGTTGDGRGLLPFHANLLQAAISNSVPVQPVALRFADASGPLSEAVVFVGDTTLVQSLWRVACAEDLRVQVQFLDAVPTVGAERRALADQLRARIEAALAAQ